MEHINWLAVVVSAVSSFMLGGLWYSPLMFLKPWLRANGVDCDAGEEMQAGHPARVFGVSFVLALIAALAFGWLVGADPGLSESLRAGVLVGGAFVATSFGINYQFANRPVAMWLVDGGYHLAQFMVYGLVFGLL